MKHLEPKCYSYIRFSSPEQITGDSLNRQLKLSREYASKNGLALDESLNLKDLGLSAYSGDHKIRGALGKFLELIEKGKIAKGSKLIVESLDRLSRELVLEALNQFIQIIKKGITIVTLADNMEYSADTINANIGQLMFSLTIMSRAHEESAMKSKRLKSAWDSKRKNIEKKKLTKVAPAWLRLNKRSQVFEPIPDRVKVVQRIFKLYLDGNGAEKIARTFNMEGLKEWGPKKNGWHKSYIQKILHNKSVLGEFQPHKIIREDGRKKRVPVGKPIKNYFPEVVSDQDFFRAQERLKSNKSKGGKTGKINNLFGHIAKCGYCGAPMQYINKGNGDTYLVCDNLRRGLGCINASFRYDEFEKTFIEKCGQLNLKSILPIDDSKEQEIDNLYKEIEGLNGKIVATGKAIENLDYQTTIAKSKATIEHITKELDKALSEKATSEKKLKNEKQILDRLLSSEKRSGIQLKNIQQLIGLLSEKTGDELIQLRQKLRSEIRQLIKRIDVFPNGLMGRWAIFDPDPVYIDYADLRFNDLKRLEYDPDIFPSKEAFNDAYNKAKKKLDRHLTHTTGKQRRCFSIFFNSGRMKEFQLYDGEYSILNYDPEFHCEIKSSGGFILYSE